MAHKAHDICRRASGAEFRRHELHERIDVVEEVLVTRAEIVESGFTVGCVQESMLWTFSIASESHIAFAAHARKGVLLVEAKFLLLFGADHLRQMRLHDVA